MNVWTEPFADEIIAELKLEAAKRFRRLQLPADAAAWRKQRPELQEKLSARLNLQIDHKLDLDCRHCGKVECDGYSIMQLCYQSRPDFYVTASLYVPEGKGPFPAIMNLHGHHFEGHLAGKIQQIAHEFAKSGYVVLSNDAFGAGERSTVHGQFEYHGAMRGGGLLSLGESLMGIQIIDNMRGVDLLLSLPYVDGEKIGATGGSGGGNQTMYLAAFDERVKAAVPVVSVGSYQSYVGGTNCICELLVDGLDICEESALLALIAPRPLKICNALHDINPTFHVAEMMRSHTEAAKVFAALDVPENLSAMAFNGPHSYPPEVRAAAIGFFDFFLRGKGHGMPVKLPSVTLLPEKDLMVFPDGKRFPGVCSIPEYTARRAAELKTANCGSVDELKELLRLEPETIRHLDHAGTENGYEKYTLETSRGRMLPLLFKRGQGSACRIYAAPGGKAELEIGNTTDSVVIFDPWGCGETGYIEERFAWFAEQHQLARSLMWLGRRLLGEWCMDYRVVREFAAARLPNAQFTLSGRRDSAVAALFCAILDPANVSAVAMVKAPRSFAELVPPSTPSDVAKNHTDQPQDSCTMAMCLPGILKWGDITHAVELARQNHIAVSHQE